jgi:hypothetical protein
MPEARLEPYTDERGIKDENQLLQLVTQRFDLSAGYRKSFDDKFDKAYQYYRSYRKFDAEYWYRSQLFIPHVFAIIESITPDFVEALIGGDDFFDIHSTGGDRQKALNMEMLMKYQINERMQYYQKILMWVKSVLIFGNGVVYNGWNKKQKTFTRNEWMNDPLLGMTASIKVKRTEDIVNDPMIDTVFIKNCFPQPHKESIKESGWFIERSFVDWDFILSLKSQGLENSGVYKNLDKIKESKPSSDYSNVSEEMNNLIGIATGTSEDPINKPVELLKYWREDRCIIVANKKVVIRDTDNPFEHGEIPYSDAKNYPLDKEFFGISDVDLMIPLQDICNDMTNLRLDNLVDSVNTSYVADRNKGINPDDIISRPSGIIWSDDVNAIIPQQKPIIPAAAYQEPEVMYKNMQRATGAWEYMQGATPERAETATGIIRLQQAASKRFGYRIKLFQKTSMKHSLTQMCQLNQQLLPLDYCMKVFKEDREIRLNPWDIAGKFSLQVSGSSKFAGLEERMMDVWKNAKNDPYFDQLELRKRLMDIMDIPNYEKLLKTADGMLGIAQQSAGQGVDPREGLMAMIQSKIGQGAMNG